jgi:SWI/SNF-related matrix-associated actin-dependent regulator of chromatin subfamily A-like protein 1
MENNSLWGGVSVSLRDYQHQGVAWLVDKLAAHRAVLLADDAGLGKSLETLTTAHRIGAERVLIICPAGARRVWSAEIHRWFPAKDDRVCLVEPGTKVSDIQPRLNPLQPVILILGYDETSNFKSRIIPHLKYIRWDLLVLDECHYLKNPSYRTQAIYGVYGSRNNGAKGLADYADKVLLLSGTPTPNHAGELWQHYRTFWPSSLGPKRLTQYEFEDRFTRYRDTVFGRQVTGSKNQGELRAALADVVLRRRKSEVLTELPPLQLQDIPLAPSPWRGDLKLPADADDEDLIRALRSPDTAVATMRRELGLAKTPGTIAWVQERMASTHKLLIFAWHHAVIDLLYRGLTEFYPVVVTGETSPKARAEAVARFQDHAGTRIFIGQILAAGTAITLTAASEVAIVEPSWVPGENYQAICRAHRLGQRDSVLASFLFLPGTLDERIMAVFRRKAGEIAELQGDDNADNDQHDARSGDRGRAGGFHPVGTADTANSGAAAIVAAAIAAGYCC